MATDVKKTVDKVINGITKELPAAVKENKGAAIGAVVGYLLADTVEKNKGVITAVLGGLVGHAVDEKKEKGCLLMMREEQPIDSLEMLTVDWSDNLGDYAYTLTHLDLYKSGERACKSRTQGDIAWAKRISAHYHIDLPVPTYTETKEEK